MKVFFVFFLTSLNLLSCAPKQTSGISSNDGQQVDESSYKAVLGTKWCLPQEANQTYVLSWTFVKDGTAFFTKTETKTGTGIIVFNQKKIWSMNLKTLIVNEPDSGAKILEKDLNFGIDFTTGKKLMTWSEATTGVQSITLTECGT